MNNEENNNQVVNNQVENTQPKSSEPEILGELRKEKIGKPMVVVEMAVLILIVVAILPIARSAMYDENSTFYQLLHGRVDTPDQPGEDPDEVKNGFELSQLNNQTIMKANNLILKNFSFKGNELTVTIYSNSGVIDLDEEPYYIEIYTDNTNKLGHLKLTGTYDSAEKQAVLSSNSVNYNSTVAYLGKVVIMKDSDYPTITLNSDKLVCSKGTRSIEYTFQNNYLSEISDYESFTLPTMESSEYLSLLTDYRKKVDIIKGMNDINEASAEESSNGFIFRSKIILKEKEEFPKELKDNSYYVYNTEAKVINYAEEGKGFDCE